MTTALAGSVNTPLKIIDADTHLTEPHDLWTKRAPAALRERVPQVKMYDGKMSWVIDGDKSIGTGAPPCSVILKDGTKVRNVHEFIKLQFADVHLGSSQVKERLAVMDQSSIYAQIVYPNVLGFGGHKAAKVDASLRLSCVQIYNDAMAEIQQESSQRLFPMALLPWWDVRAAVREAERAHSLGLRGVNINSDPHTHWDDDGRSIPDLAATHWDLLWESCAALDMPINFHIGSSEQSIDWMGQQGWPSLDGELRGAMASPMMCFNNARVLANIIYSGILNRFPRLKFVSVESGIGWVPFLLEALDYQLAEFAASRRFDLKPSEYFKRNFHACFWFEQDDIARTLRRVGIDNALFETDYPHPTSLYPIHNLERRLSGLTAEERGKVLSTNAARLYRISIQ